MVVGGYCPKRWHNSGHDFPWRIQILQIKMGRKATPPPSMKKKKGDLFTSCPFKTKEKKGEGRNFQLWKAPEKREDKDSHGRTGGAGGSED